LALNGLTRAFSPRKPSRRPLENIPDSSARRRDAAPSRTALALARRGITQWLRGSRASSLLRRAKAVLLRLLLLDFQRNLRALRNAPSEGRAKPALRRSCDMDVARAPMGYRDVPSGRASVAGEFARVARLCRARMAGQAFLVPFVATDKRDSPEGAKQDGWANSVRRRNTQAKAAQALFAGMTRVGGLRLTDASLRTAPSPACGRGLGRGRSCIRHPRHRETVREQARSQETHHASLDCRSAPCAQIADGVRSYGRPLCQAP